MRSPLNNGASLPATAWQRGVALRVSLIVLALVFAGCDGSDGSGEDANGGGDLETGVEDDTGTLECLGTEVICDGRCVDLDVDFRNCGECGFECPVGHRCDEGVCVLRCPSSQVACGDGCYDLDTSADHCGACDNDCGAGRICADGVCVLSCPSTQQACGERCANVMTDRDNCGVCGVVCADGLVCSEGVCSLSCGPGLESCDGSCVDVVGDRRHCGGCNQDCGPGRICDQGECVLACPAGMVDCTTACANLDTDVLHCGSCGHECPEASRCVDGQCQRLVTGVSMEEMLVNLATAESRQLVALIEPEDAHNQQVVWLSSAPGVVSVNNTGQAVGQSPGQGIITVTTLEGNYRATAVVNVRRAVDDVVVNCPSSGTIFRPGQEFEITAQVQPLEATNQAVIWSTDAPEVGVVNQEGLVRALSDGEANITVTSLDSGVSAGCVFTVESILVSSVSLSPTSVPRPGSGTPFHVGDEETVLATLSPSDATDKRVLWHSSDEAVVKVSLRADVEGIQGGLKAIGVGEAVVTVITVDGGKTASAPVTVSAE